MLIERIYDEDLAQASYFIGCQRLGEAIVVDARRDVAPYLDLAAANGMKITAVTETHIHADYLSGTRELAAATGAQIYISGEGGADWQYGFEGTRMYDGDAITIGNLTVKALHTPGHTPEHLSYLVTDGAFTDQAGYLLSGDFVFAGDLGRPDLLDEAAGGVDTRFEGARQMFASLRDKFLTLPDYVQVHPGHGAGSACGKALGAIPSSTVGYERLYAWWGKYLAANDEQGFIHELLDGQPEAHAYFARMKKQNKQGPAVMGPRKPLEEIPAADLVSRLESREATFVDTRSVPELHAGTVPGACTFPRPARPPASAPGPLTRSQSAPARWSCSPRTRTRPTPSGIPWRALALTTSPVSSPAWKASRRPHRPPFPPQSWIPSTPPWCWTSVPAPSMRAATSPDHTSCTAAVPCGTWTSCPLTARSWRTARPACAARSSATPCATPGTTSSNSKAPTPPGQPPTLPSSSEKPRPACAGRGSRCPGDFAVRGLWSLGPEAHQPQHNARSENCQPAEHRGQGQRQGQYGAGKRTQNLEGAGIAAVGRRLRQGRQIGHEVVDQHAEG